MKTNSLTIRLVLVVSFLVLPGIAAAGSPTDWVRASVLEVKSTLSGQEPGAGLTQEQFSKTSRVLGKCFNFHKMAVLALGRHWRQRSPQERQEFVHLFRELLERSFLLKLSTHAGVVQRYVGESIERDRAIVQALVKAEVGEVPIDYFLLRHDDTWKVYDLGIEGVRLSRIYRAQFNKVITRSSYNELLRRMHLKLEEAVMEADVQR
ncbi:MAG: phospholipid-binding protein MlaC [Candidatus Methylomirabilales bacterium]